MPTDKQTILALAVQELNQPGQPWQASIEGDTIVARWRWMDANFFGLVTITNEVRDYTFTVTLRNNGTWKEHDVTKDRTLSIGLTGGSGKFS